MCSNYRKLHINHIFHSERLIRGQLRFLFACLFVCFFGFVKNMRLVLVDDVKHNIIQEIASVRL